MEYAKTIAELINGEVKTVEKENGIIYTGVTKKVTTNVSPIIYIDNLYENGVDVLDASKKVKEKIEQSNVSFDIDFINDYEKAKPRLQARLYNNKTNVEVSKSAERYGFDDLIIVPILVVSEDDDGTATIKVTRDLLAKWDKSATEVISDAIENLNYEIMDMASLLGIPCMDFLGASPLYVVTNKKRRCGAASVLKAKDELNRMFPEGYIVLPSSVHEVIVVKNDDNIEAYTEMVKMVNSDAVAPEEVLSDKAYKFN